MLFLFIGRLIGLLFKTIGKFFVVLFESENIEDQEDIEYVAKKIREDNSVNDDDDNQQVEGTGL